MYNTVEHYYKNFCMQRNWFISHVTYQKGSCKDAIVSAELEPAFITYPFYLISVFLFSLFVLKCRYRQVYLCFWKPIVTTHYICACFLRANCRFPLLSTVYCPFEVSMEAIFIYLILNSANLKVSRIIMIMVNVFYELRCQLLLGYDNRQ